MTEQNQDQEKILVCVAWPYANGPLHLGHIAGCYLPADIFARYHRAIGNDVLMVSGSDQHGTPITVTAEREGVTPDVIADRYHQLNSRSLVDLGVSFDLFWYTSHPNHKKRVQDIFRRILENGYIEKRPIQAAYCPNCQRFLPDRYIEGTCPHCDYPEARGDQCDNCGKTLDPDELVNPLCKLCRSAPELRQTEHYFLRLSAFEERLKEWIKTKEHWRANTRNFTENWLRDGLKDRAITRDLTWGIEIPLEGYENKRIYVWFEAVSGYFTTSVEWSEQHGQPEKWTEFWHNPDSKHYYFLAKDNIPFHTIIWPSILMGYGGLMLPYDVPANEYLMLSGAQFSKSREHAVWVPAYLERFAPDALRYYLSINMPETHDTDFTWEDFVRRINDELVATYGNFVHRVLTFTSKHFGAVPPEKELDDDDREALAKIDESFSAVSALLGGCNFKKAMKAVMALAHFGNRYFDKKAPWALVKSDKAACGAVLRVCLRLVKALCMLTYPFLPFSAQQLWEYLGYTTKVAEEPWEAGKRDLETGTVLQKPKPLFKKLDLKEVLAHERQLGMESAPEPPKKALKEDEGKPAPTAIDIDRLMIRLGTVAQIEDHPKADKLYVLKVKHDDGDEPRQLVAGLRPYYTMDELTGVTIAVLTNLKPAKLRGVKSNGMLLAADDDTGTVSVLTPAGDVELGERIIAYRPEIEELAGESERPVHGRIKIDEFLTLKLRIGEVVGIIPLEGHIHAILDIGEELPGLVPLPPGVDRVGLSHQQVAAVISEEPSTLKPEELTSERSELVGKAYGYHGHLLCTRTGTLLKPLRKVENGARIR